ncbi:MAG: hypothetical protein OXF08_02085 [Bacteroidetes bacterium]|nr:hypothetical protein [Bacteroidota bacterium]
MNFDNTVSIYMIITRDMEFSEAAQAAFHILRDAQERFPDWPRSFYLDIQGHRQADQSFTEDWVEFQQEFWFSTLAPFLTSFDLPLTGPLVNPDPQKNDFPDSLDVR